MRNSGKFQNSIRAVTINSEFSLPGLIKIHRGHLIPKASLMVPPHTTYTACRNVA